MQEVRTPLHLPRPADFHGKPTVYHCPAGGLEQSRCVLGTALLGPRLARAAGDILLVAFFTDAVVAELVDAQR